MQEENHFSENWDLFGLIMATMGMFTFASVFCAILVWGINPLTVNWKITPIGICWGLAALGYWKARH